MNLKKVITYNNPYEWEKLNVYEELKSGQIHICATLNMQQGISKRYGNELNNIFSIRQLLKENFSNWYSAEIVLKQYFSLSKIMKDLKFENKNLEISLRKEKKAILDSIRFLVQGNVDISQLRQLKCTERETIFLELWELMLLEDKFMQNHIKLLRSGKISKIRMENKEINIPIEKKGKLKVFLHGFYYITPEQQSFFDLLERSGFELVVFQYYEPEFAETHDFIKNFINEDFGWESDWNIYAEKNKESVATLFLNAYESNLESQNLNYEHSLSIKKYKTFFDFLQTVVLPNEKLSCNDDYVKKNMIFAPNIDEIQSILEIYSPEIDKNKRSFLHHPIGKFLINIHKIYRNGSCYLNSELLFELFSSGWLVDEQTGAKANDFTSDLEKILPYFQNCQHIDMWCSRITELIEQTEVVNTTFKAASLKRKDRLISSPFNRISYLTVNLDRLLQIKEFIHGIRLLAEDLFEREKISSSIEKHFSKLQKIMENKAEKIESKNNIEYELLSTLIIRMSHLNDSMEFLYDDVAEALQLYLNGKFEPNQNIEENIINPFLNIDGEMFNIEADKQYYFMCLDENSFPIISGKSIWPFKNETLNKLASYPNNLQLHLNIVSCTKEISRFLFFIMLKFIPKKSLNLSWIENLLGKENLSPAMYVRQLKLKEISGDITDSLNFDVFNKENPNEILNTDLSDTYWSDLYSKEIEAEYNLCPRRFYYGYILNEYPIIKDDFLHPFIFTEIFRLVKGSSKPALDTKVVLDNLNSFFPQWLSSKKEAIAYDFESSYYRDISKNINEAEKVKRRLHFPGIKDAKREHFFMDNILLKESISKDITINMKATPDKELCIYCPYNELCDKAIYGVDK